MLKRDPLPRRTGCGRSFRGQGDDTVGEFLAALAVGTPCGSPVVAKLLRSALGAQGFDSIACGQTDVSPCSMEVVGAGRFGYERVGAPELNANFDRECRGALPDAHPLTLSEKKQQEEEGKEDQAFAHRGE